MIETQEVSLEFAGKFLFAFKKIGSKNKFYFPVSYHFWRFAFLEDTGKSINSLYSMKNICDNNI